MKLTKILATAVAVVLGSLALTSYTNAALTVTPWTAPDYIDTEWNVFAMGSLTITNWTKTIIILDRNLWATQTWTSCPDYNSWACGYFFQRGNNYWFGNPLTKTGTEQVDTTGYSRANPYVSDTFIKWWDNNDWSTNQNDNLRWWSWDTTSSRPNPDYMRQWPCPGWYHVPTYGELNTLKTLAWNNPNNIITKFYIPLAGIRYIEGSQGDLGVYADLWSSSLYNNIARNLDMSSNKDDVYVKYSARARAYSLRCFKDTDTTTSVLSFNTRGWQGMQWQTVPTWGTGHTPGYEPKKAGDEFMGWYKDENCSQPFDFQTDVITADTTIYAKWANDNEDGDWLITVNIAALNNGQNTCTLDNYIFSWIFASPSVVFRNISQSMHCVFGNANGSVVTLQLSGDLTDGSGNTIPAWNVRLKNTAWTATPAGLQWASSAINDYTSLNQTLTLFNKVANKIWEATWSAVDIQVEIPWWTPDGVYNWILVLSY